MLDRLNSDKSKDLEEGTLDEFDSLAINSWFNEGLEYVEQDICLEVIEDTDYCDDHSIDECSVEQDFTEHIVNTEEIVTDNVEQLESIGVSIEEETVEIHSAEPVEVIQEPTIEPVIESIVEPVVNEQVESRIDEPIIEPVEESLTIIVEDSVGVEQDILLEEEPVIENVSTGNTNLVETPETIGVELVENDDSPAENSLTIIEDEQIEDKEPVSQEDAEVGSEQKVSKPLKIYEYVCVIFVALTVFFGISYVSWSLDNSNTHGVVSGLISETTSKHNMTVTADTVIDDVQIGQVYDFLEVDFAPLIERNNDVQGYLKVKGLEGLEYPVMQTMDNEYYLDKDIDKNKSGAGWLFVDCRNNIDHMQFNTIIYGHNRVDGLMFGNLKKLINKEVNSKPDADKIYFNTRNNQMIYEICSIYVTTYDDWEYYDVDFSEKGKENFIARLNKLNQVPAFSRSDLSTMDNFLTLSTCHGSAGTEKRFVVHARLVAIK